MLTSRISRSAAGGQQRVEFGAARGGAHGEAMVAKIFGDHLAKIRLVVHHDETPRVHCVSPIDAKVMMKIYIFHSH